MKEKEDLTGKLLFIKSDLNAAANSSKVMS